METMYDITAIRQRSEAISDYISEPSQGREKFLQRRADYKLNSDIVRELKRHVKDVLIVTFSAEWCPDCHRNVPVLDLISEATGLEVRVFGHMMKNAKNSTRKWAIPPSPKEVEEFGVTKIPYMVILDRNGMKLGEIIENPPPGKTLEETILEVLKRTGTR